MFNLSISPESYGDCNISVKKQKIECFNKEEIEDSKIIIPETVIQNKENNIDLFRLKGIISDTDDISCAINENYHIDNIIIIGPSTEETETTTISSEEVTSTTISSEEAGSTTISSEEIEKNNTFSKG